MEDDLLDFNSDNDIGPSSDVESLTTVQDYWESLTKPCKVVLERCNVISIREKREYSNQNNNDHDYAEIKDLKSQEERKSFANQVEPLAMANTELSNIIKPVKRGTSRLPKSKRKRRPLTLQPIPTLVF